MNDPKKLQGIRNRGKWQILLFGLLLILLTACGKEEETPAYVAEVFPVVWLNHETIRYQPMLPNKTKLEGKVLTDERVYMSGSGTTLVLETEKDYFYSYKVYKTGVKEALEENKVEAVADELNPMTKTLYLGINRTLYEEGSSYVMELIISNINEERSYYLPFYYGASYGNAPMVTGVYGDVQNYNMENKISMMGTPKIWIQNAGAQSCTIQVQYTGAIRKDYQFVYSEYTLNYEISSENGALVSRQESLIDKDRMFYSSEIPGWKLGNSHQKDQGISSENGKYVVYANDVEIAMYDRAHEKLYSVYRTDRFDGEYVRDEIIGHQVDVIRVGNNGEVYFTAFGYINDGYSFSENVGIVLYKYTKSRNLELLTFIEYKESIEAMKNFIEEGLYSNEKGDFFIFQHGVLYQIDAENGQMTYINTYLDAKLYREAGILCWEETEGKRNSRILILDLNQEEFEVKDTFVNGAHQKLLKVDKNKIYIGVYNLENIYEKLNGDVIYPFDTIVEYDFNATLKKSTAANDFGNEHYYASLYEEGGALYAKIIRRSLNPGINYQSARVSFQEVESQLYEEKAQTEVESDPTGQSEAGEEAVQGNDILSTTLGKSAALIYAETPKVQTINRISNHLYELPPMACFEVRRDGEEPIYFSTLQKAMKYCKDLSSYQITQIGFNTILMEGFVGKEIITTKQRLREQYLEEVKVIPQKPELPRGCEVTSLAVLLDYYMEEAPDKMELSEELKKSTIPYQVIDGFVNFADMHVEFAGSMTNASVPGLGVYVDPIREVALSYMPDRVENITGSSFEQVLMMIAEEHPVLVVIPNQYGVVPNSAIEVWKTEGGYMEVTYQEHSVVLLGYDQTYVYYSDPSKAIIDKKPIDSFAEAWESIGSQALIILE